MTGRLGELDVGVNDRGKDLRLKELTDVGENVATQNRSHIVKCGDDSRDLKLLSETRANLADKVKEPRRSLQGEELCL